MHRRQVGLIPNEKGFAAVVFAISITVLLGIAGFCVDLGNVYLQIENSQHAADAAALAGAPFLPDDPNSAKTAADQSLAANHVNPANVVFEGPDPAAPSFMKVTVRNTTQTVFARLVGFDAFKYERTARAAWRTPLGLGSPFNVLGAEPAAAGPSWQNGPGPAINYFLTQNPGGNQKENMDRWSAVKCAGFEDGCTGNANDDYDSKPRLFDVEIDNGTTGTLAIEVYDPELDQLNSGPAVNTVVQVWAPKANPTTDPPIAVGGCSPQTYATNDPAVANKWARVCTLQIDGVVNKTGRYVLGMWMPGSQNTVGQNDYSLRAAIMTGPAPGAPLDVPATTHVHVYAQTELATHHEPSALLNYYMVKVPTSYAGQTLTLDLYDLGETGAQSETFKFVDTGIEPTACHLDAASQGISLGPTNGKCTFAVGPYFPKFDGHLQKVSIPIDPSYTCVQTQQTSCWLYLTSQSGNIADEGSSASIEDSGTPLRLYPN